MEITNEMLKVAITKSVEAGLLPRRALKEEFEEAQKLMRMILQSAFDSMLIAADMEIEDDAAEPAAHSSALKNKSLAFGMH